MANLSCENIAPVKAYGDVWSTNSNVSLLGEISDGGQNMSHRNSDLVITEVHYDPVGDDIGLEYVEIFNATGAPIDLENYRLRGDVDMDFPAIQLPAGTALALVDFDTMDMAATEAFRDEDVYNFSSRFTNTYETNSWTANVPNAFSAPSSERSHSTGPMKAMYVPKS